MNPTEYRLSEHFLLSDFMGCHSVYTRGYANVFEPSGASRCQRVENGQALCEHALEPLLREHGPLSISYGYISPELSREIVHYQDPYKPSHHRWDLGAAADVCVHEWTNGDPDDDSINTAPVALALELDKADYPYSRLITYSESPYLCVAVSAREVQTGAIRKAFYENRYAGQHKAKPLYKSSASSAARNALRDELEKTGLRHGWRGAGYPTYHGGGKRQYHHIRTSKYTMLSDWLFDLQSIANGARNIPNVRDQRLWETICAAGDVYDAFIDATGVKRFSIIAAYVSHTNPYFTNRNDWRTGVAKFAIVPPATADMEDIRLKMLFADFGPSVKDVVFPDDGRAFHVEVHI